MTDMPNIITANNPPSAEVYAMECTLQVDRREVLNGAEKSVTVRWEGFASLEAVNAMLDIMKEAAR